MLKFARAKKNFLLREYKKKCCLTSVSNSLKLCGPSSIEDKEIEQKIGASVFFCGKVNTAVARSFKSSSCF